MDDEFDQFPPIEGNGTIWDSVSIAVIIAVIIVIMIFLVI